MFKNIYRQAYDQVSPAPDYLEKINASIEKRQQQSSRKPVLKPAIGICTLCLLFMVVATPVLAKEVPFLYSMIQRYAPALSDSIVPQELSSSSQGIKMQVEAVEVKGNEAEVLVSFTDEEGFDYINGEVDMYDSYGLYSYAAESNIGGCFFLEYNPSEDKAYFKIDVKCDFNSFSDKVTFKVGQLLTRYSQEKQDIDILNRISKPVTKKIEINGWSGEENWYDGRGLVQENEFTAWVLDRGLLEDKYAKELNVTGVAYMDGILRVQVCRGNFRDVDRHMELYLVRVDGTEQHEDYSVSWQQIINGEVALMEEYWFEVAEEELPNCSMYGIYHITDGSVEGSWDVTFAIE